MHTQNIPAELRHYFETSHIALALASVADDNLSLIHI